MDKRNKLLRRYLASKFAPAWNDFKKQRNLVVGLQQKAKIDYFISFQRILRQQLSGTLFSSNWDALGTDHTSIANLLNDHFVSVSSSIASLPPPSCSYVPSSTLSLLHTTPEWCERSLTNLKSSAASGCDNISSHPLKTSKSIISYPLSKIIISSISSSTLPDSWKCSSVCPLHSSRPAVNYWRNI